MAKVNSRAKGARGEREWANFCKDQGYDCRRGQQFCGANGDADVVGLPGIYIEVKRYGVITQKQLEEWLQKAWEDSKDPKDLIIIAHREDNHKWYITTSWIDLVILSGEVDSGFAERMFEKFQDFIPVTMLAEDWFYVYKQWELEVEG